MEIIEIEGCLCVFASVSLYEILKGQYIEKRELSFTDFYVVPNMYDFIGTQKNIHSHAKKDKKHHRSSFKL